MAKKVIADAIENELKNGNVSKVEKFSNPLRNMDLNDPLVKDEIIEIPTDFEILQEVIQGGTRPAEFIIATITSPSGAERSARFYANQLAKVAFAVDENGKSLGKQKTKGTAAEFFARFVNNEGGLNAAFDALKGKKIKVVGDEVFSIKRYGTNDIVNTHIYTYDLVD